MTLWSSGTSIGCTVSQKKLEEFFEVCDGAGLRALASVTGDVDLATDDGRFMARILGAVARKESDDKSRRIRRKALEIAQAGGRTGGGTRPFGFEADRVTLRPAEAKVIRDCAERLLAGESIRSLCADLRGRDVATVTGSEWKTQTLRRLLMSGRVSGQREYHGELIAAAQWPAIISAEQTAQIRALLGDPARRTNRTVRRYLLTRLLRCSVCGETLVSRPRDDGRRRYVCAKGPNFTGCGHTAIVSDGFEALVVEGVLHRLDSPALFEALSGNPEDASDAKRIQVELDDVAGQLDELAAVYGRGDVGLSEWLAAREPIERRAAAAKKQLAALTRTSAVVDHIGQAGRLRERWLTLPLSRRHAIVAAIVDHIVIRPGRRGYNRFDPARVEPVWRV